MDETWDAAFYDDQTRMAYRIQARRLSIRDGAAIDQAHIELAQRDLDDAMLLMLRQYPLLRYGTARAERTPLDEPPTFEDGMMVVPDEAVWEPFVLTEDTYLDFAELLAQLWVGVVLARNPHRDMSYEALKKKPPADAPMPTSAAPTNGNE